MAERERARLTGFGRTAPSVATVARPASFDEVAAALQAPPPRGVIARGLGRSYGDSAQNGGGLVLDTSALTAVDDTELATRGVVRAQAGVSLDQLMRTYVPQGWFVPVTTGTRLVTMGGAVAADVHGKNHEVAGSFTRHVEELTLATPAGGVQTLRPGDPLFDATCGGMGLTGVVLDVVLRLKRIPSSRVSVDTDRLPDLDAALAAMAQDDPERPYSVAWLDPLAKGRHLGRTVLTRGRWATPDELPAKDRQDPHAFDGRPRLGLPMPLPTSALTPLTVRAFNELWFRKAPKRARGQVLGLGPFFHPLDGLRDWNGLYGPKGFVQHQVVVPHGAEDTLRAIVEGCANHPAPAAVTVLKRFGAQGPGHLSFPAPGWTLALDVPAGIDGLTGLLERFDEEVAAVGGRVYLPKDARLRPELLGAMYPRLDEWRALRHAADPDGVLVSDQARRLRLSGPVS